MIHFVVTIEYKPEPDDVIRPLVFKTVCRKWQDVQTLLNARMDSDRAARLIQRATVCPIEVS